MTDQKQVKNKESKTRHPEMTQEEISEVWHHFLTQGSLPEDAPSPWYKQKWIRPLARKLPSEPRCRICYYPFDGVGGFLSKTLFRMSRSRVNPHFCNQCELLVEHMPGGAEVEVTVLFADLRGSTGLAETMKPAEFSKLINRFYNVTSKVLFDTNAIVEKLVGDAVTGFYPPGLSGADHARVAVDAARQVLKDCGFGSGSDAWVPVGIGVHTGVAFVGSIKSDSGVANVSVLGDTANIGARLAGLAGPGEVYVSRATAESARLDTAGLQHQQLTLKGRTQPIDAYVVSV